MSAYILYDVANISHLSDVACESVKFLPNYNCI